MKILKEDFDSLSKSDVLLLLKILMQDRLSGTDNAGGRFHAKCRNYHRDMIDGSEIRLEYGEHNLIDKTRIYIKILKLSEEGKWIWVDNIIINKSDFIKNKETFGSEFIENYQKIIRNKKLLKVLD